MSKLFERKESRELQNLRQRQAGSVIQINPNLKGFTQRFDPDVSRAALLRAQRERAPTAAQLEKSVGVKAVKKLKKRRGKNLRGETARNIREQRRFERGERRDRPEQEPRIVGDPAPAAAAAAVDPALERRRLDLEEARERNRQLDRAAQRRADQAAQERELAVRRGELAGARVDRAAAAAAADRAAAGDRAAARLGDPDAQLRLAIEGRRITAQDAQQRRLIDALGEERGERERLLGAAQGEREDLRKEIRFNLGQEVQERGRVGALREAERLQEREQRELLGERGERQRDRDRQARTDDAIARAASDVARDEREREDRIRLGVERTQLGERSERLGAEERAERLQREEQRIAEGTSRDRERRQESAQAHEERIEIIDRLSRQQDLPDPIPEGEGTQADRDFLQRQFQSGLDTIDRRIGESEARTAEQIRLHADRVSQPQQRDPVINIYNPVQPPLPPAQSERRPSQTAEQIAQRVRRELEEVLSPRGREDIARERRQSPAREAAPRVAAPFTEQRLPTPPTSPRTQSPPPSPPRQVREDQPEGQIRVSGGAEEPADLPTDFDRPFGPLIGDEDFVRDPSQDDFSQGEAREPEPAPEPQALLQLVDPDEPPSPRSDTIGFVGDVANLEIEEPQRPTIQPLQSDPPRRRAYIGRDPRTGPPSQTLEQFQAERRERVESPESSSSDVSFGSFLEGIDTSSPSPPRPRVESPPRPRVESPPPQQPEVRKELSLEDSLRVAQSELSTLQRRERSAGQSSRGRAQAARSSGSLAGTKFARKSGGVPPAELKTAEARVKSLENLVRVQRDQERIRKETEQAREAGTPRQGFTTGGGLVEEEEEADAQADVGVAGRRTNFQLYESLVTEIDSSYTRGRAQGGARGSLPFIITNTTNKKFKGLQPGQSVSIDQVERDGTLGYYPGGQVMGKKAGITRIQRSQLEKQIKAGKLKVDRVR